MQSSHKKRPVPDEELTVELIRLSNVEGILRVNP